MSIEYNPQLPIDTDKFTFWGNIPEGKFHLNHLLVNTVASYSEGIKLVKNPEVLKTYSVYASPDTVKLLTKLCDTIEYRLLRRVVAAQKLSEIMDYPMGILKPDYHKVMYAFWLYRADNSLSEANYWADKFHNESQRSQALICKANSLELYSSYLGAIEMSKKSKSHIEPNYEEKEKNQVVLELLDKCVLHYKPKTDSVSTKI